MPQLERHAPYFPVKDVAKSAAEYERRFGFTIEYAVGTPAEFAIVTRGSFFPWPMRSGERIPSTW